MYAESIWKASLAATRERQSTSKQVTDIPNTPPASATVRKGFWPFSNRLLNETLNATLKSSVSLKMGAGFSATPTSHLTTGRRSG